MIGIAAGLLYELKTFASTPANKSTPEPVVVTVPQGQTLNTTAAILLRKSLIKNADKFVLVARFKGYDKRLKAGEYLLSAAMTPLQLLDIMVKGTVKLHKLTIPEGYNLFQIAELVEASNLGTKTDFIQAATDAGRVRQNGLEGKTFEGYLFPDTYFFPKEVSIDSMIAAMVKRFWSIFTPEWQARAKDLGLTVHQVVTLASIIEKETDPTVIYGIENFDGNLTRKHLTTSTPYNTYKIRGLPIGPIANPGAASLQAALYPDETKYIYFVSRKDTTHQFSTNLKQHNQAVKKYQLRRRKRITK